MGRSQKKGIERETPETSALSENNAACRQTEPTEEWIGSHTGFERRSLRYERMR